MIVMLHKPSDQALQEYWQRNIHRLQEALLKLEQQITLLEAHHIGNTHPLLISLKEKREHTKHELQIALLTPIDDEPGAFLK